MLTLKYCLDCNKATMFYNYFMTNYFEEITKEQFIEEISRRYYDDLLPQIIKDMTKEEIKIYLNDYFSLMLSNKKEFKNSVIEKLKFTNNCKTIKKLKDILEDDLDYNRMSYFGINL